MLYYATKGGLMDKKLDMINKEIENVKKELMKIGEMRPGSLTQQYKNRKEKSGGYYQISYTYKMKSKTEYVRPENVDKVREQVANFKRFRNLVQEWTDLSIKQSQYKIEITNKTKKL